MACYFIAQINIRDAEAYQAYLRGVDRVVEGHGGVYLAVDDEPSAVEGTWGPGRIVIIRFADAEAAHRWYASPEYQELLSHRLRASECRAMFVDGVTAD